MKIFSLLLLAALLISCASPEDEPGPLPRPQPPAEGETRADRPFEAGELIEGQLVYVPIYSHIYFRSKKRALNLTATLSIRNTDLDHPISVTAVRYYDSDGQMLEEYLEQPLVLAPLASEDFVVEEKDMSGGSGANFIVAWGAETAVSEPIIEAIMISTMSTLGISFTSTGRVIRAGDLTRP